MIYKVIDWYSPKGMQLLLYVRIISLYNKPLVSAWKEAGYFTTE
jgi:hypothetical protein